MLHHASITLYSAPAAPHLALDLLQRVLVACTAQDEQETAAQCNAITLPTHTQPGKATPPCQDMAQLMHSNPMHMHT